MKVLNLIRRHLVALTNAVTAIAGTVLIANHAPMAVSGAVIAVLAAGMGLVGMAGVVSGDRLLVAVVGFVKGSLYLAVLLGAHGFWADPAFQSSLLTAVELTGTAIVAVISTSVVDTAGNKVAS